MTNTTDKRPEWNHSVSEETMRWLTDSAIVKITHHREMTSEDTSNEWITLHNDLDEKRDFVKDFFRVVDYFKFDPDYRGLIEPTYRGEQAIKTLEAIDEWEERNKKERAEFERLKRKFEA